MIDNIKNLPILTEKHLDTVSSWRAWMYEVKRAIVPGKMRGEDYEFKDGPVHGEVEAVVSAIVHEDAKLYDPKTHIAVDRVHFAGIYSLAQRMIDTDNGVIHD